MTKLQGVEQLPHPEYVHQEFPKWKYHDSEKARIVQNETEEAELGDGWRDTPKAPEVIEEEVAKVEGSEQSSEVK